MSAYEFTILLCSASFALFVIFLIALLLRLMGTVREVNQLLRQIREQLGSLEQEPKKLIWNLNTKIKCLDSLFRAISNIGDNLEYRTQRSLIQKCRQQLLNKTEEKTASENLIDCAILGLQLWKKYKQ